MAELHDLSFALALDAAKHGRFADLANELERCGIPADVVDWVRAGCKTSRGRGHPRRDPDIEANVVLDYHGLRERFTLEELPEKVLELTLMERYSIHEREVRRIVAEDRRARIAIIAKRAGISEAEAEARWNERLAQSWKKWRAMRSDEGEDKEPPA